MPDLIKIGKTTSTPEKRMAELHSTGVPTPFELEFSALVEDCTRSERAAHRALRTVRVSGNREFFRITVKQALEMILPNIGQYQIHSFRESHGIKAILDEIKRREDERKEIERKRILAQKEAERLSEIKREQRRTQIQNQLADARNRLVALGNRPTEPRTDLLESLIDGISTMLMFVIVPFLIPLIFIGVILHVIGINIPIPDFPNFSSINTATNKYHKAIAPFFEIDAEIASLKRELEALGLAKPLDAMESDGLAAALQPSPKKLTDVVSSVVSPGLPIGHKVSLPTPRQMQPSIPSRSRAATHTPATTLYGCAGIYEIAPSSAPPSKLHGVEYVQATTLTSCEGIYGIAPSNPTMESDSAPLGALIHDDIELGIKIYSNNTFANHKLGTYVVITNTGKRYSNVTSEDLREMINELRQKQNCKVG